MEAYTVQVPGEEETTTAYKLKRGLVPVSWLRDEDIVEILSEDPSVLLREREIRWHVLNGLSRCPENRKILLHPLVTDELVEFAEYADNFKQLLACALLLSALNNELLAPQVCAAMIKAYAAKPRDEFGMWHVPRDSEAGPGGHAA